MEQPQEGIHSTALVYPGVTLGDLVRVGAYVILGEPEQSKQPGEVALTIGPLSKIRSHTVIYAGNTIGEGFQTGHNVLVREDNEIAEDVSIGSGTVVEHHVKIGRGVRLHSQVFVPEYSILEDEAWLGPNVVLTNAKYPQSQQVKSTLKGPHIKTFAKIGANSTLLPGITIGAHALVGAGSVVTKDVPDYAVVSGNPAKVINDIRDLPYEIAAEMIQ